MAPSPSHQRKRLRLHSVGRGDRDGDVEQAFRVLDRLRKRKATESNELARADAKISELRKELDKERAYSTKELDRERAYATHVKEQREELKAKFAALEVEAADAQKDHLAKEAMHKDELDDAAVRAAADAKRIQELTDRLTEVKRVKNRDG